MNIAFFTNNYLPNVYGVPKSIKTFKEEFERRGHTVYVFAPNFSDYKDENKNIFRYPSLDINIRFRLPLAIPYSGKMDKILENLKLDIIHSHHPNLLGSTADKWAKKKKVPLVFTWHTLYDQYTNFVPFLPSEWAAKWIISKAVKYANQADAVVVPTESIEAIIKKWGVIQKSVPIATGINEDEFQNSDRKKIREKYQIRDNEILLLLVSRLTEEKNIKFLFEAVAEILKNNPQAKFMLVGDGYLRAELGRKAQMMGLKEQIIFAGLVDPKEIKNYYAAGDIFVYASKSETQGMIITEAMYMQLPIVALKAPGISSLVETGKNGILVSENSDEFAAAVEKLAADADLRQKMGEKSLQLAKEKYTATVSADKLLTVYAEVIKNKK